MVPCCTIARIQVVITWVQSIIMNQDLLVLTRAIRGEENKRTSHGMNDQPTKKAKIRRTLKGGVSLVRSYL